jgi:hypothetical protein
MISVLAWYVIGVILASCLGFIVERNNGKDVIDINLGYLTSIALAGIFGPVLIIILVMVLIEQYKDKIIFRIKVK